MNNIIKNAALITLLALPSVVLAARPSINELNTRVNQLEAEVNKHSAHLAPIIIDGNGDTVGTLLEFGGVSGAYVINENGFLFRVLDSGKIQEANIAYDNAFCIGSPQYQFASNTLLVNTGSAQRGQVIVSENPEVPSAIYYVPKNAVQESLPIYRRASEGGSCSSAGNRAYRLIPNDPSITGVHTDTFPLPLSIDRP